LHAHCEFQHSHSTPFALAFLTTPTDGSIRISDYVRFWVGFFALLAVLPELRD
jgi:hypothetical protein